MFTKSLKNTLLKKVKPSQSKKIKKIVFINKVYMMTYKENDIINIMHSKYYR